MNKQETLERITAAGIISSHPRSVTGTDGSDGRRPDRRRRVWDRNHLFHSFGSQRCQVIE